jgi:hypothetical protein
MVELGKFVHTENGKIIMSVILGFGLATFFREMCKGQNCKIFHAPPLKDFENKIYKYDNKCYSYSLMPTKCDSKKKTVRFA